MTRRPGLSLVELLVVTAIVGGLIGLLLPAVQRVRAAAATAACRNNLKQIGLACHNYAAVRGGLPPSRVSKNNDVAAYIPPNTGRANVLVYILPYIEQDNVLAGYRQEYDWSDPANTGTGVLRTVFKLYLCPAAPAAPRFQTAANEKYVIGFSPPYVTATNPAPVTGFVGDYACLVQVESSDSAVTKGLVPGYSADNPAGYGAMRQNVVTPVPTILDGASNTTLFSEFAGRPGSYLSGPAAAPAPAAPLKDSIWAGHDFRIQVAGVDRANPAVLKGGDCVINCNNKKDVFAFHPGGANVLFADGSARFLRDTTPARTLVYLVTATGDEPTPD